MAHTKVSTLPLAANERAGHANNAFDSLRMMAALAVLVSHSFVLYGLPEPQFAGGQSAGSLAVAVFFAISGYLICQSWQRDPDLARFSARRGLRIFPGLFVVVALTALVLGPLMSTLGARAYLLSASPWSYLWNGALALGSPRLNGVFESNPYPFATNGSLWTLRYELLMYVVLALSCRLFANRLRVVCVVAFAGFAAVWVGLSVAHLTPYQMPFVWRLGTEFYGDRIAYLGAFFFAGTCAYLYADKIPLSRIAASILVLLVFLVDNKIIGMVMLWLIIPYANSVFAFKAPRIFRSVNGYDYSYGIYIYAFPVQQCLSQFGSQGQWGWATVLILSLVITIALAALSWHLVEKPALSLKRLLKSRAKPAPGVSIPHRSIEQIVPVPHDGLASRKESS